MTTPSGTPDAKAGTGPRDPGSAPAAAANRRDMSWIPGGEFLMGSDSHYPEEPPAHRVKVNPFWFEWKAAAYSALNSARKTR